METLICARHYLGVLGLLAIHYNKVTMTIGSSYCLFLTLFCGCQASLNILFCLNALSKPPENPIGSMFKIHHRIYHFPSAQLQLSYSKSPSSPYLDYCKSLLISLHPSVPHYSLFSKQQPERSF